MIYFAGKGHIHEKVLEEDVYGFFLAVFYSVDKIKIIKPKYDQDLIVLWYFTYVVEELDVGKFLKKLSQAFPDYNFLETATTYLVFRSSHFTGEFFYTIDDTGFLRLLTQKDKIKYFK